MAETFAMTPELANRFKSMMADIPRAWVEDPIKVALPQKIGR